MRRAGFALPALALCFTACAGGTKPVAESRPPTPTERPEPQPTAAPTRAPTPTPSSVQLLGGWSRTVTAGVVWSEGLVLAPDGRLGLVGLFGMDGIAWRLEGAILALSTSSERHPDPVESSLRVEEATPTRLVLYGEDYLAGAWERHDFAALTGTVTYRLRVALTPEAVFQVELRDVSRQDVEAPLLAKRIIRKPGQAPVPFVLDYDPAAIESSRTYAVSARIADRGQLQFVTDTRIPVITSGAPTSVEIVVVPVR